MLVSGHPDKLRLVRRDDVDIRQQLPIEGLVLSTHVQDYFAAVLLRIHGRQGVDLLRNFSLEHENVGAGNGLLPDRVELLNLLVLLI